MTTGFAMRGGDAAIESSGNFHSDVRKKGGDELCVAVVQPAGLFLQHTDADLHAGLAQARHAFSVNLRIRVDGGHHHPLNARRYQSVRTGSGSSLVTARFQSHVGSRAVGLRACLLKGHHLSVVAPVKFVKAFAYELVAPN